MATPNALPTYAEYKQMVAEGTEYDNLSEIINKKYQLAEAKATKKYYDDMLIQGKQVTDLDFQKYFDEALAETEKRFVEPALTPTYGEFYKLKGGIVPDAPAYNLPPKIGTQPDILTALSRQQVVSEPSKVVAPPVEFEWDAIKQDMMKPDAQGNTMPEADANANITALKATIADMEKKNPGYDRMAIFDTVAKELQDIENVATKEIPMDTSGVIFDSAVNDPYVAAFQQQITNGKIPDYSSVQARFLGTYLKEKDKNFKNANYDKTSQESTEYKTIKTSIGQIQLPSEVIDYIQGTDPRLVPPVYSDKIDAAIREGGTVVKRQLLVKPEKLSRDIDAVLEVRARKNSGSDNWFLDPDKKAMVLADPESFVEQGFFTDTSRIGGTRETIGSWGLRAALSPLNMVAGAVTEALSTEDLKAIKKAYREKETPLYAESPILANIALNKGFTGEAIDVSNALNLEGWQKYATVGGAFAGDILDPTFAITSGLVKTGKNIKTLSAAQKAFGVVPDTNNWKIFTQTMATELNDDLNIFKPIAGPAIRKYAIQPFDIRGLMTGELVKSARIIDLANSSKTWEDWFNALEREGLVDNVLSQSINEQRTGKPAMTLEEALTKTIDEAGSPETVKIWQEFSQRSKQLDDIKNLEGDNITKSIEAAALTEERIASRKWIDELMGPEAMKNKDFLIDEDIELLRKKLYTTTAKAAFVQTAPELVDLKDVVAVTKNTYAHSSKVPEILAEAKDSVVGRLLWDMRNNPVVQTVSKYKAGEPLFEGTIGLAPSGVVNAFKIEPAQAKVLSSVVEGDTRMGDMLKNTILRELAAGELSFDSYRMLVDRNIDQVAKSMEGSIQVQDLERMRGTSGKLMPEVQKIFEPKETRTGAINKWLTQQAGKLLAKMNPPEPVWINSATIQQKQLVKTIQQKAAALDSQLRRDVNGIMGNAKVQELYGLSGPPETRLDALGIAIVGPKADKTTANGLNAYNIQLVSVMQSTNWAINRIFYNLDYVENLTDSIGGVNKLFKTSVLNDKGIRLQDQLVSMFAQDVVNNPGDYVRLFEQLLIDIQNGVMKNEYFIKGITEAQVNKLTRELFTNIEAELMAGQYYFSKTNSLIEEELIKLVGEESFSTTETYVRMLDQIAQDEFITIPSETVRDTLKMATAKAIDNSMSEADLKLAIFAELIGADRTIVDTAFYGTEAQEAIRMTRGDPSFTRTQVGTSFLNIKPGQTDMLAVYAKLDPLITRIMDDAKAVVVRNGLNDNVYGSMDNLTKMVDDLFSTENMGIGKLIFGEKIYNELQQSLFQGRNSIISGALDKAIRDQLGKPVGMESVKRWLNFISSFRYTVLLGMRPRFHGVNVLTANAITYATVGQFASKGMNPFPIDGANVAFRAMDPSGGKYFSIAVQTPSGKSYTYGEISDLIYQSGIRSEYAFVQAALSDQNMISFLRKGRTKDGTVFDNLRRFSTGWSQFTTQEDVMFRAQIMINALREGRSEAEALELAKRSMFDYNNMSQAEKQMAANYFIFYAFARQNYGTLLKSMTDPKLFARYTSTLKFKRGLEMLLSDIQDRSYMDNIYLPDYIKTNRSILSVTEGQEYDFYLTSPPVPSIDALTFITGIIDGNVQQLMQQQLLPELKLIFGVQDPFKQGDNIPPEFINLLALTFDDPNDMASFIQVITGGVVTPKAATGEQGGVQVGNGTYRFDLDSQQQEAYMKFIRWFPKTFYNVTATETFIRDITKIFDTEGTAYQKGGPLSSIGATTPMKGMKPEQTTRSQTQARKSAMQAELNKLLAEQKRIEEELIRRQLEEGNK